MAYRDDVAALRARCEALEEELARARAELVHLDELEWERAYLEERAADLERQLFELRSQIDPRNGEMLVMSAARRASALFAALSIALLGGFTLHMIALAQQRQMMATCSWDEPDRFVYMPTIDDRGLGVAQASYPLGPATPAGARSVSRVGQVVATTGPAPVPAGASCVVSAVPTVTDVGFNCRVTVTCDDQVVYGGPMRGYLVCGYDGDLPSAGEDDGITRVDGDPRMTLDLPHDRVIVSDGPDGAYSLSIRLQSL